MKARLADLLARHESHAFAVRGYEPFLAQRIGGLIAAGRPASCLRLGDGEGNILGACDRQFRNLQRLSAQKAAEMHLGKWFPASVLQFWKDATFAAIGNADIIGVPCEGRIEQLYRNLRNHKQVAGFDIRGACGTINALRYAHACLSGASPRRIVTNCWFHRDLLPYYPGILGNRCRIGLISCHPELPMKLRSAFAVKQVDFFQIPGQISNTGRRPPCGHYPDRFEAIMEELKTLKRGQIVLVAAGILGKIYCNGIKERGGIALDIGSVADVWIGQRARRYHNDAYLEKWRL
ncbi:MAG: hypothetical protein ACREHV_03570 [Rhizomicrobium sp.]